MQYQNLFDIYYAISKSFDICYAISKSDLNIIALSVCPSVCYSAHLFYSTLKKKSTWRIGVNVDFENWSKCRF